MVYKIASILALAASMALTANAQRSIQGLTYADSKLPPHTSSNLPKGAMALEPVTDFKSKAFTCRTNGLNFPDIVSYKATGGEMFIVTWDKDTTEALASNGKGKITGPCNYWLASTAQGTDNLKWFRIGERGYTEADGWCTDFIRKNGRDTVSMPDDLPSGDYLFRAEVIDLTFAGKTNADDITMGPQFYPDCIKYTVTGGKDTKIPTDGLVSLADAYQLTDQGLLLNLTADGKPPGNKYKVPGPAIHNQRNPQ
ncbi:hypothetical protein GGI20_003277 [Coemansia sp. BCRC 34301]|nr:hypothetical protein GGI20_003277 [Coemansia sp. BCRC 34301]